MTEPTFPSLPQDLAGKTAVVTGSSKGIGLAIAQDLLARGARVMFNGTKPLKEQPELVAMLEALSTHYDADKLDYTQADIADPHGAEDLMGYAATKLGNGSIDILVNNAGIQIPKAVGEITPAEFNRLIGINLCGAHNAIFSAIPYLKGGRNPSIINISSVHGHVVSPARAAYCASKHGLEALLKTAAVDLAKDGIRVNGVSLAFVDTDLAQIQIKDRMEKLGESREQAEAWRLKLQQGKWIEMGDVTQTVANIAIGNKGIKSGESLLVDNGYVDRVRQNSGGVAYFDSASRAAYEGLNQRIEAQSRAK